MKYQQRRNSTCHSISIDFQFVLIRNLLKNQRFSDVAKHRVTSPSAFLKRLSTSRVLPLYNLSHPFYQIVRGQGYCIVYHHCRDIDFWLLSSHLGYNSMATPLLVVLDNYGREMHTGSGQSCTNLGINCRYYAGLWMCCIRGKVQHRLDGYVCTVPTPYCIPQHKKNSSINLYFNPLRSTAFSNIISDNQSEYMF